MIDQPFAIPSAVIGVAALPMVLALVPKNRLYGVRTKKTLSEDRIWFAANRLAGWLFLASSVIYLAFSAIWPMAGVKDPRFGLWALHLCMFAVPLLVSVAVTMRYTCRL
jgi:uncharacterized membrane protein